ncbi:MAG TPA: hypothetical protein VKY36_03815 [Moheibacter sp.]|nr:hypothetical protein [Moheibacter sp.]
MKIYQVSGLGANEKAFKYLKINPEFETVYIPWLQPEELETLGNYAERMAAKIDTSEEFILMGLSFGGIIVQEMNRFLHPKLNILISTVKSREELPLFMKFSSKTNLHRLVPPKFISSENGISYALFRKLYDAKMPDINEFFEFRDPYYLKWSMDQIVNWKNHVEMGNYVHFHGNKDIVFPVSKIKNYEEIEGGTHLMVVQKARKLSELINRKLETI